MILTVMLNNKNSLSILNIFITLLFISIISRGFPIIQILYYAVPAILAICISMVLYHFKKNQISIKEYFIFLPFVIYCLLTSFWSTSSQVSATRSLYFLLLSFGMFSVIKLINHYNLNLFNYLLPANILVVVLSLISLTFNIPAANWSGGSGIGFMGFSAHQNTLASAVLFTMPAAFYYLFKTEKSEVNIFNSKYFGLFIYFLIFINIVLLILTYSRAALLSLLTGITVYLILSKSKKIIYTLSAAVIIFLIACFTITPLNNFVQNYLDKNGEGIFGRRMMLWQPSYQAVLQGGLFGLGFGISAPDIKTNPLTGSYYENGRYIREKGNSTLALIEETGVIGFIIFIIPFGFLFIRQNKKYPDNKNLLTKFLVSTLIALIVHAQFEAWLVGIGSISLPLFFLFWFKLFLQKKSQSIL